MNDEQAGGPDRHVALPTLAPGDVGIGTLFWRIRDAIVVADAETGRIVLWNPTSEALFGYSTEQAMRLSVVALVPERLRAQHSAGLERYNRLGHGPLIDEGTVLELPARHRSGEEFLIEMTLSPLGEIGSRRLVLAIIRDITKRKEAEQEQVELLHREQVARAEAEALVEIASRVSSSLDLEQVLGVVVEAAHRLVGADLAQLAVPVPSGGLRVRALAGSHSAAMAELVIPPGKGIAGYVLQTGCPYQSVDYQTDSIIAHTPALDRVVAEEKLVSAAAVPIKGHGEVIGVLNVYSRFMHEFTASEIALLERFAVQAALAIENARANEQLSTQASHDALTNLYNRGAFSERLDIEIARAGRYSRDLALVLIDIDHFKRVNDSYGHPTGDTVLRWLARTIQAQVRQPDWVARYGGEEFAIVLTETNERGAEYAGERLRLAVAAGRIALPGAELSITVSTGVASYPQHASDATSLVERADAALYRAKEAGRNRVYRFA